MIRLPLPIEVSPTRKPPNAPMAISFAVGNGGQIREALYNAALAEPELRSIKRAATTSITPMKRSSAASTAEASTE